MTLKINSHFIRRDWDILYPFFICTNSFTITCLLKTQVIKTNGSAFSDIMMNAKILLSVVHFSIQFTKGNQTDPPAQMQFTNSHVILCLTKSAHAFGCHFSDVDVFKSLFYIPLLVPEQLLWSRRSKAASTISPAAFGSPSNKNGLMCQGLPVNIFQDIPGTHKKIAL